MTCSLIYRDFERKSDSTYYSINMQQMADELINFRTISNESDFSVFPNFAYDNISIEYTNPYSMQSTVKIYNLNNQVIDKFDIKDATTDYDVSGLASGMYIIELNDDTNHIKYMKKFIKL